MRCFRAYRMAPVAAYNRLRTSAQARPLGTVDHRIRDDVPLTDARGGKAVWVAGDTVQHIYATKEFERQVYGRMSSADFQFLRMSSYALNVDVSAAEQKFASQFTHPTNKQWAPLKARNEKAKPSEPVHQIVECDLYLKLLSPTSLELMLKDVTTKKVQLSHGANNWSETIPEGGVVLMEVSETPNQLRNKLWQLCRAMQNVEELKRPAAVVVCLNGDAGEFDVCANHIKDKCAPAMACFGSVPCYAIWTAYRNTYSEIAALRTDMTNGLREQRTDMNALRAEQRTEMSALRTDMTNGLREQRTDMNALRAEQHTEMSALRTDMTNELQELKQLVKAILERAR